MGVRTRVPVQEDGRMRIATPAELQRRGADVIREGQTRTLLALVACHRRDGRATVRSVAEEAGRSVMTTYHNLLGLRERDLVTWDEGRTGTLRPLVAPVPFGATR